MADPNDVMSLFEEQGDGTVPQQEEEPPPLPAYQPPPQVDPQVAALQQQVGQLTTMMGQLFQQQYQRPPEPVADPYAPLRQPQDFFTEQDAFSLLKGEKPIDELNRMGNKIKQSVAEPLLGVIQQQKHELEEWRKQQQMQEMRRQQADEAQRANTQFFQDFPDLKPMESLVRLEAQYLAQEAQRNPSLLSGRTNQDAANMLAERVRKAAQGIALAVQGSPTAAAPLRSPYLERGSPPRNPAPVKGDANQNNLREMAGFMQNKKKRA